MSAPRWDLNVVQSGPSDAPAVVLLHGMFGSTAWWDRVLPALRDRHVVRVDLLGHGRSAKPVDGYGVAEQAREVAAMLDRIGVRNATVIGHSFGGFVGTALAEQRPDLVSAIALIGTPARSSWFTGDGLSHLLLSTPLVGRLLWRLRTEGLVRAGLRREFRGQELPEPIVADMLGVTYRCCAATFQAGFAFCRPRSVPDRLIELGLPTLVVFGSRELRWQPSKAEGYRRVPYGRVEILDGLGHTPMLEYPDAIAPLLHEFTTTPPDAIAHRSWREVDEAVGQGGVAAAGGGGADGGGEGPAGAGEDDELLGPGDGGVEEVALQHHP
ncbi:pimeloyl-ACP methyl ester carboxylesterase [Actinomadura rupiterrae]|nr:pimeloyl-ACP methyl ester carboxylesterase [Actinomadura rupiterrae]